MTRLGGFELASPYVLAPMAGVSQAPYRAIVLELGAGAAPTELISAKGLEYGSRRTAAYLRHGEAERPFWVQLFGGEPPSMARAAALAVGAGAHVVDINMGCPVKKVTRTGAGAALMCDVPRAVEVVRAVRAAVGPGVPVTAKIRSGWDQDSVNCVEVGRALEGAGVAALAIHARTRAQGYAGRADWRWIAALKRAVSVPVVGNGDVRSVADAQRMVAETGCDMVMVGRGALGNPWVFRSLVAGHQAPPTAAERLAVVSRHLADHVVHVGEPARAVREFRPHLGWYSRGLVGGAAFRAAVMVTGGLDAVEALCREFFGSAREGGGEPEPEVWDEEGSG